MKEKPTALSRSNRLFFQRVHRAAFSNPFGSERQTLDREIYPGAPAHSPDALLEGVLAAVASRLASALPDRAQWKRFVAPDRDCLRTALLFDLFHRYCDRFDDLVLRQQAAGDEPIPCPFVGKVLAELLSFGFSAAEAADSASLFYQLRRAYFLIEQGLVGRSRPMRELRLRLWQCVFTGDTQRYATHLWNRMEDFSTLLLGETGTGKGAAAAAIGRSGLIPYDAKRQRFAHSFTAMFTPINLSQYPESLIESELFGHRKGAFTGAVGDSEGVLARTRPHGVLFLDEIGEASPRVQIKLLHVLQDRQFTPVGSRERRRFHGRVVAATNRTLADWRRNGGLREDFYYRLSSATIAMPSLRERLRDAPDERRLLLGRIVERLLGHAAPDVADSIESALAKSLPPDYAWPGNVRELEQAARRILLDGAYTPEFDAGSGGNLPRLEAGIADGRLTAHELLSLYCARLHERLGSFESVARRAELDRRTAKKYADAGRHMDRGEE